jgi:pyruvate dehydrogenase E1 component alpha subunit
MGLASKEQIDRVKAETTAVVENAVKFAEESPNPDPAEIFTDVLA